MAGPAPDPSTTLHAVRAATGRPYGSLAEYAADTGLLAAVDAVLEGSGTAGPSLQAVLAAERVARRCEADPSTEGGPFTSLPVSPGTA